MVAGWAQGYHAPMVKSGYPEILGGDYVNIWGASTLLKEGHTSLLWDINTYYPFLCSRITPDFEIHNWSYPPTLLLLLRPFAYMPYEWGYAWWIMLTGIPFLLATKHYNCKPKAIFLLLLMPNTLFNVWTGQNGFLTAGLMALALQYRQHNPWKCALSLALLTIKPHLGVLFPLLLLYEKRRKVIGCTLLLVILFTGMSIVAFGAQAWVLYFTKVPQALNGEAPWNISCLPS